MYNQDEVVSTGRWIFYLILIMIPVVNLITIFYFALGSRNKTIRNLGKAFLILLGIAVIIGFILGILGTKM